MTAQYQIHSSDPVGAIDQVNAGGITVGIKFTVAQPILCRGFQAYKLSSVADGVDLSYVLWEDGVNVLQLDRTQLASDAIGYDAFYTPTQHLLQPGHNYIVSRTDPVGNFLAANGTGPLTNGPISAPTNMSVFATGNTVALPSILGGSDYSLDIIGTDPVVKTNERNYPKVGRLVHYLHPTTHKPRTGVITAVNGTQLTVKTAGETVTVSVSTSSKGNYAG